MYLALAVMMSALCFCGMPFTHDDVIKWKYFPRYWPFVRGMNSPHKGQWRGGLTFSLICARINGWINNGEAGDLRRHRAHCDVIVMRNSVQDGAWEAERNTKPGVIKGGVAKTWIVNMCLKFSSSYKGASFNVGVRYLVWLFKGVIWNASQNISPTYWKMCSWLSSENLHYTDVTMGAIASQITSLAIVYSTAYSGEYQRKHQSSASLAFVRGIHRGPVNSPHKWPVTRKMYPFDDVIMRAPEFTNS